MKVQKAFDNLLILGGADIFNFLHIFHIINKSAVLLLLPGRLPVVVAVIIAPISLRDSRDGRQSSTDINQTSKRLHFLS